MSLEQRWHDPNSKRDSFYDRKEATLARKDVKLVQKHGTVPISETYLIPRNSTARPNMIDQPLCNRIHISDLEVVNVRSLQRVRAVYQF